MTGESLRIVTPTGEETDLDAGTLAKLGTAVRGLGRDGQARESVLALCRDFERRSGLAHGDVREHVTGPIVDALHAPGMQLRKQLADGSVFDFTYRSKIARDFVLSPDERPDHVWEPQTTRLLVHLARRARHVVIGGGYIGDQAILVARAMPPGGVCHVFEPNAESARLMTANAAHNGVANLEVNQIGLWNQPDAHLRLEGNDSHARPVLADHAGQAGSFRATTIDAHAKARGIDRLDLVMLDIEGGEQAALEGAIGFLRRAKPEAPVVVFEIHRSYVDWSHGLAATAPVSLLRNAGYSVFALRDFQSNVPMRGCLLELLPLDAVYLEGPPHGFNMLAVRDEALLDDSVFRLCRDKSPKLLLHKSPILHHPTEWLTHLPSWLGGGEGST
jgi:FkbM family methyltransferase